MNNDWLVEFITLINVRNFTKAAEICCTTQSSMSRHIQAIEKWVGAPFIKRNAQPIEMTRAGEHFLKYANDQLSGAAILKSEIKRLNAPDVVRMAVPYSLASTRLGNWLNEWTPGLKNTLNICTGSSLDCARMMESREVDLSVYHEFQGDAMRLDERRFERAVLHLGLARPYASAALIETGRATFPGTSRRPMSLLSYTPDSFFIRVFEAARTQAFQSLHGTSALTSKLSEVQADMAIKGLGVAWLSNSSVEQPGRESLIAIGDGKWDVKVQIVAYRAKGSTRRLKNDIWERIRASSEEGL